MTKPPIAVSKRSYSILPVILSGGSGTRLWPLSRKDRPKQFLRLTGDQTMLQLTIERVKGRTDLSAPMIIASSSHELKIRTQLEEIGVVGAKLILEPVARNTAPAIALAALSASPETMLLVMPSDHVIKDVSAFLAAVEEASAAAAEGYLVTFGIKPNAPETGFGYIKAGGDIGSGLKSVERFVEKPDAPTASAYFEDGSYFWNAGIFLFRAKDFLAELSQHAPEVLKCARKALEAGEVGPDYTVPDQMAFARSSSISVDYAVMEKAERIAVCPVDIGWSDIGSWDALYEYLEGSEGPPEQGSLQLESSNCLVRTSGPSVATINIHNMIIVATSDAVLVLPRGESQKVKTVVENWEALCGESGLGQTKEQNAP